MLFLEQSVNIVPKTIEQGSNIFCFNNMNIVLIFYSIPVKKEFFRPIAKDNPRKPLKEAYFHWGPRSFF